MQNASTALRAHAYECDRITHNELMAVSGEHYESRLRSGIYSLLWITTPCDWYVRTPGKRGNPHWQRLISFIKHAHVQRMHVIIFGPPGFLWKLPNFKENLEDLQMDLMRMRLCRLEMKYDTRNSAPSGSYIQVATNVPIQDSKNIFGCRCKVGIDQHVLDWYGKTAERAEWRRKTRATFSQPDAV